MAKFQNIDISINDVEFRVVVSSSLDPDINIEKIVVLKQNEFNFDSISGITEEDIHQAVKEQMAPIAP